MEGTSGISGWSGHGHAAGPDRSKDQYEAGIYLENLNLSDDEIKDVFKDEIDKGEIEFLNNPFGESWRQAIRRKDNKYINMQKYMDKILDYHRTKFGTLPINERLKI